MAAIRRQRVPAYCTETVQVAEWLRAPLVPFRVIVSVKGTNAGELPPHPLIATSAVTTMRAESSNGLRLRHLNASKVVPKKPNGSIANSVKSR